MRLVQKIVYVHNSEKHSMEHVDNTFCNKKYTKCFVAIKDDFVFSYISGSQSGRYRPPGVNWTIQGVDK